MRKILMAGAAALLMAGPAFAQSSGTGSGASLKTHPQLKTRQPPAAVGGAVKGGSPPESAEAAPEAAEKGTKPGATVEPGAGKMGGVSPQTSAPPPAQENTRPPQNAQMPSSGGSRTSSSMSRKSMGRNSMQRRRMGHKMAMGQKGGYAPGKLKSVPYDASTDTYLQIAQKAVSAHHKTRADIALGRAETNLLTNSYVAGSVNGPINSPAIDTIRKAREAVDGGNFSNAGSLIQKAMGEPGVSQGSNGGNSGAGMQNNGMQNNGGTQK